MNNFPPKVNDFLFNQIPVDKNLVPPCFTDCPPPDFVREDEDINFCDIEDKTHALIGGALSALFIFFLVLFLITVSLK